MMLFTGAETKKDTLFTLTFTQSHNLDGNRSDGGDWGIKGMLTTLYVVTEIYQKSLSYLARDIVI